MSTILENVFVFVWSAQHQPKHESRFEFSSWWRDALNVLITRCDRTLLGPDKTDRTCERVKRWTNEAEQDLRACFDCTHWTVFEAAANDLDELTETITSYISYCEDMCILTYYNDKTVVYCKTQTALSGQNKMLTARGTKSYINWPNTHWKRRSEWQRGIILKN